MEYWRIPDNDSGSPGRAPPMLILDTQSASVEYLMTS